MTRIPATPRPRGVPAALCGVAALLAGMALLASPTRAAGQALQFTTSHLALPVMPPSQDIVTRPADGTPLYERAPMPNQNTLEPQADSGGPDDPVQPSVINRGSKVAESGGYSRNTSANSAQESRMKPGLGFALHMPTE